MSAPTPRRLLAALAALPLLWLAACDDSSSGATVTLDRITVSPATVSLQVGETQQLTVTGHYSDLSSAPLTTGVSFETSNAAAATVSAGGLVTAVGGGGATITATASGESATSVVTVTPVADPGVVFDDDYAAGVIFAAFGGSTNALSVDAAEHAVGAASLRVEVPATGYTGGALVASAPRDLTAFNAVSFWAKASKAATLNVTGLGNDGAGAAWSAELGAVPLTTTWAQVVIPIPAPSKATAVPGLFHFAEGSDEGAYTIWLDDVRYVNLTGSALAAPTAATVGWPAVSVPVGGTFQIPPGPNTVTFTLPALTLTNVAFRWYTLASSATGFATVSEDGLVTGVAAGTSDVSAQLGTLTVPGVAPVTVTSAPQAPTVKPAAPTAAPADVISLLSTAYTNVAVDTWRTSWSAATLTEVTIDGDPMKQYSNLDFVGVEFTGANLVDATTMTHLHVDVWTPNATTFRVKLVDFGANGVFDGPGVGDDSEAEVAFDASSTPALATGGWVSLDIPFTAMPTLAARAHLAQLIFSAVPVGNATVFVDNVYFRSEAAAPVAPTVKPAAPTAAPADVISLLSTAYTNVPVDTWRTSWSAATLTDVTIDGDPMKQYSSLDFVGVEFTGANLVDATAMTHFHVDVWTPNATTFRVKLVDFGANGVFDGPGVGDDSEAEVVFDASSTPALATGGWVSLDIPFTAMPTLAARAHLAQLIFSAVPVGSATVYVDNVYFRR